MKLTANSKIRVVTNEEALTINETVAKLYEIRERGMASCDKNERQKAIHADRMLWALQECIARQYYGGSAAKKNLSAYPRNY